MVAKLETELERERLERDWSKSELDRVKSFWEITKRDLEDKKAELRNMENTVASTEERHQLEIKVLSSILQPCIEPYQYSVCSFGYAKFRNSADKLFF